MPGGGTVPVEQTKAPVVAARSIIKTGTRFNCQREGGGYGCPNEKKETRRNEKKRAEFHDLTN